MKGRGEVAEHCPQALTLPQVATAAEVEYRTLHTWLKRGLVRATCRSAQGSGNANLFARPDALEARILADLRRAGLDLASLERAASALQRTPRRLVGDELLLINGTVVVLDNDATLEQALASRHPAVLYDVAWASRALQERARL
jgi:DNA-binding transcriptional MerR regulator